MTRLRAAALLCLLLLTACGQVRETASRGADCVSLARDVAASGLGAMPSAAEAEQAARRLESRVAQIDDAELRQAASALRDRLRELQAAADGADPTAVDRAAEAAREAARDVAATCSLPVEQFLG